MTSTNIDRLTSRKAPAGLAITAVGAALVVVGLMLPWVELSAELTGTADSGNGFDPDFFGTPILIATLVALAGAAAAVKVRWVALLTILCSTVIGFLAIAGNAKVGRSQNEAEALGSTAVSDSLSTGMGVWLTLAAAVVVLVGGVVSLRKRKA